MDEDKAYCMLFYLKTGSKDDAQCSVYLIEEVVIS